MTSVQQKLEGGLNGTGTRHRSLGAYFPDLPSNMLGSFLMGLLAASGTLGIPNGKEIAILPAYSSWQVARSYSITLHCTTLSPHSDPARFLLKRSPEAEKLMAPAQEAQAAIACCTGRA